MIRQHDFVVDLACAGESAANIFKLSKAAQGNKALCLSQIYNLVVDDKAGRDTTDKRHQNPKSQS